MLKPVVVIRHGLARPLAPPASSTTPYFASWRKWNEHVDGGSSMSSLAAAAVSGP